MSELFACTPLRQHQIPHSRQGEECAHTTAVTLMRLRPSCCRRCSQEQARNPPSSDLRPFCARPASVVCKKRAVKMPSRAESAGSVKSTLQTARLPPCRGCTSSAEGVRQKKIKPEAKSGARREGRRGLSQSCPRSCERKQCVMFADIRALESLRVGMPMLIFHAEPYVQCMSADGATPDSFLDCKSSWCSSHAWENHERCVLRAAPAARPHIAQH